MNDPAIISTTPRDSDLGLKRIANNAGLSLSVLSNGCLFAIEHEESERRIMLNQVLGSPIGGSIARLCLSIGKTQPLLCEIVGPGAKASFGADQDRIVWEGDTADIHHRVTLWLAPDRPSWLWRVEIVNRRDSKCECAAMLVQDLGLGEGGFLMNNEAYASQYIDHHIATDDTIGAVIMTRQNLAQRGAYPWVAQGCLDGARGFATDAMQVFGPRYRDGDMNSCRSTGDLPSLRLQHEVACAAIETRAVTVEPGARAGWTLFGVLDPDHREASGDGDLAVVERARETARRFKARDVVLRPAIRSLVLDAPALTADEMSDDEVDRRYPARSHEERKKGTLLSFFTPDGVHNRHVVLAAKEHIVARRHGTLLRSGQGMLPDETTLCATSWMHGVFAAQLTIGNTSLHKLFSVSRDPYNITRASGLRLLMDEGEGWRLLTVPSVFEMGLSDCRWIYKAHKRTVIVHAAASGDDPAMQWNITVEGEPCRFIAFGHLVLGEREFERSGRVAIDGTKKRFTFRPDPQSLWSQRYPEAVYHLTTSMPDAVEAIGGDELLFSAGASGGGGYAVLRTRLVKEFRFAVTGSLENAGEAERLAAKYERGVDMNEMRDAAARYWRHVTRGIRIIGRNPDAAALDTIFPWLAHNAMIHLTVPHGLEQYTGAAWGTRDVCQGPVEFLLTLEHDETVKAILRIVFAQQFEERGDWPQWFMLEPYSNIRDRHAHGDVILWPLKALCDYIETTGDLAILDEPVAWRRDDNLEASRKRDAMSVHADKLIATASARSIPGTRLMRYGEGDWNDSLQPADPKMRDWMVSSWTVALFFEQLRRYARILARAGRKHDSERLETMAAGIGEDFNRHLIRDGVVAGYALFEPGDERPELLLHPSDTRTGLHFSLLPMTGGILAGLFTPEQTEHHLRLVRQHLLFPDGVRLMDRPVTYRGGPEQIFRRAESSAFFGREIGLMYVHAHLRYVEALAVTGDREGLWEALLKVNPIAVTDDVANAALRQRNAYFSSSDARFRDRYQASAKWERVGRGDIAADGGWRIYSSGPGLYVNMLVRYAMGHRRVYGERVVKPLLPAAAADLTLSKDN